MVAVFVSEPPGVHEHGEELQSQSDLAEVVDDVGYETSSDEETAVPPGPRRSVSGRPNVVGHPFYRYLYLHVKCKDFLKLKQDGDIEVIEDHQRLIPIYNASATMAFPYLYPRSEKSPLDCSDYKMSWYLLRKQSVFAYKLSTDNYRWPYAEEDNIHMMYQYARLVDRTVNAKTCGYLQESPDVAHLPIDQERLCIAR